MRRELEEAAKVLGERIRTSDATSEDCFELGAILLRKKLYTQATKNLERAIKLWDGAPEELAQARPAACAASCPHGLHTPGHAELVKMLFGKFRSRNHLQS